MISSQEQGQSLYAPHKTEFLVWSQQFDCILSGANSKTVLCVGE